MTIKDILQTNTDLKQGILYLYSLQTSEEQQAFVTVENNGQGFNGVDAEFMSSLAQQISWGRELSPKQLAAGWKVIAKYHRQLEDNEWKNVVVPATMADTKAKVIPSKPKALKDEYPDKKGLVDASGKDRLKFYPFVYPSKQIKELGFRSWDGEAWTQTVGVASQTLIDQLATMFGDIAITEAAQEVVKPKEAVQLPDWIANHPTLFDFQKEAIQFAVTSERAMIALAPGLGKTATSIFACDAIEAEKILIVCPKSLLYNWRNEIKKWTKGDAENEGVAIIHGKQLLVPARWYITNYDTLRLNPDRFNKTKWDAIIVDESVMLKNRRAKRTKVVSDLVHNTQPPHVWLLSGSPTTKFLDDMWSQLNIMYPKRFSSYWRFAKHYCHVEEGEWGWSIVANKQNGINTLQDDLRDIYFARTQDQVLDLPDWIFDTVEIPMSPKQDKMYAGMEENLLAELSEDSSLVADNILVQMTRLIQIASNPVLVAGAETDEVKKLVDMSPKWNAAVEMLQYEKLPAILWVTYIETGRRLKELLATKGYEARLLTGAIKDKARQDTVDDFQAGKFPVLIAHPAVGKFGYTLTAAHTSIYVERAWFSDDYYQSLHRVRRIGTTESPHVIHLLSTRQENDGAGSGTVDHVIHSILESRKDASVKLTAGNLKQLFWEQHQ